MAKSKDSPNTNKNKEVKIDIETGDTSVSAKVSNGKSSGNDENAGKKAKTANNADKGGKPDTAGKSSETEGQSDEALSVDDLLAALKAAQETIAEDKEKYLRLAADFDNYRTRVAKERDATYGNAKADTVGKLLPVYDNLERALKIECTDEAFYKGIELTMQQLTDILSNMGVRVIETAGEQFNPNKHNAVARVDNPGLGEKVIIEECKKGFTIGERVIRHSEVVVAN